MAKLKLVFQKIKCILCLKCIPVIQKKDLKRLFKRLVLYSKMIVLLKLTNILLMSLSKFSGDSCQYWMDFHKMKITSPYYPQYYFTDGIGCEWLIKTTKGNIISLEFNNFEVRISTKLRAE